MSKLERVVTEFEYEEFDAIIREYINTNTKTKRNKLSKLINRKIKNSVKLKLHLQETRNILGIDFPGDWDIYFKELSQLIE